MRSGGRVRKSCQSSAVAQEIDHTCPCKALFFYCKVLFTCCVFFLFVCLSFFLSVCLSVFSVCLFFLFSVLSIVLFPFLVDLICISLTLSRKLAKLAGVTLAIARFLSTGCKS